MGNGAIFLYLKFRVRENIDNQLLIISNANYAVGVGRNEPKRENHEFKYPTYL